MKTLKLLSLFFLSTIVFSCSDKDVSPIEENAMDTSLIASKIFNSLPHDRDFAQIQGQFYVWQTKENEIVFLAKDNLKRNLLILQGASHSTSMNDGHYEIVYLKHSIIVNNLDTGVKTYLKVPKPEERSITDKVKKQGIELGSEIDGYGLIYGFIDLKEDKKLSLDVLIDQNSIIDYLSSMDNSRGQCGSGGPGSTSCTVYAPDGGGCSVSCGSGYYACCNFTCNCNPNP